MPMPVTWALREIAIAYYDNKVYRTPYLIPELSHNELIMREKTS